MPTIESYLQSLPQGGIEPGKFIRGYQYAGQTSPYASKAPAFWEAFAPEASELIDREYLESLRAQTAGIGSGRREFERSLLSSFQAGGLDPVLGRSLLAESESQVGEQVGQLRAQASAGRLQDQLALRQGLTNALTQASERDQLLAAELSTASSGRKLAREGLQKQQTLGLMQAYLGHESNATGLLGSILGGAGGGGSGGGTAGRGGAAFSSPGEGTLGGGGYQYRSSINYGYDDFGSRGGYGF